MNWKDGADTIMCSVIAPLCVVLVLSSTLYLFGWYRGYDKAKQTYQVKHDPGEEVAYFNRVKILMFDVLKKNFGGTEDAIPLISICPIHDCCIMQPKNNEMVHYQF